MTCWQVARQVQYLLQAATWGSSSTVVFAPGSVVITSRPTEDAIRSGIVMPGAFIRPLGAQVDPDAQELPDLLEQELSVALITSIVNDPFGEAMLVGAQRTGQSSSEGRGLLEIEEELFNAIELLDTDDGVVVQHIGSSAPQPQMVGDDMALIREYGFRIDVTADRFYHPVSNLVES